MAFKPNRYDIAAAAFEGYRYYPERTSRPSCDMCGPFRGPFIRVLVTGEARCRGCDRENEGG